MEDVESDLIRPNRIISVMTELDQRYPETYEEWATSRGEATCPMKGPRAEEAPTDMEVQEATAEINAECWKEDDLKACQDNAQIVVTT